MKHRERQTARLLSVSESVAGTTLSADVASGATTLFVDDVSVFDESGWLYIGSQVVQYTAIDDGAGTVTLATGLTDAADTDDFVARWSTLYGEVETALSAQVAVLGDRDQGDELTVEVADALEDLPTGDRGGDGENCTIESDGDVWTLISASGRPSKTRGLKHDPNDPHTLTTDEITAGLFTHQLAHSGIAYDRAIQCFVNGVAYGPDQLAVDSVNGVVDVTLGGWETTSESIWFDYWYRKGTIAPDIVIPAPPPTVVSIDSVFAHGWPGSSADGTYTLTGLQAGDLVVAVLRSNSSTMDSRFTMVCDLGSVSGIFGPYYGKVWAATIAGDTSNVTFPHAGTVLRLRNSSGTPLHLDPARVSLPDGTHAGGAGSIGALPGGGSGAVSAILTGGGIGGAYGTTSWAAPWDAIDGSNDTDGGTYGLVYLTWTAAETVGAIAAPQHDGTDTWRGCALGIGYA